MKEIIRKVKYLQQKFSQNVYFFASTSCDIFTCKRSRFVLDLKVRYITRD